MDIELSDVEQKVLRCLDEERDLMDWWDGVQEQIADIRVETFCDVVRALTDRELVVLGEGVPDPYFGLPEHFEPDERVEIEAVEDLLANLTNASSFGDDEFGLDDMI